MIYKSSVTKPPVINLMEDPDWINYENHLTATGVSQARIQKLATMYTTTSWMLGKKPLQATKTDIQKMVVQLNQGHFKTRYGTPYKGSTRADIRGFLKQIFKWKYGDNETFPAEVRWLNGNLYKHERPEERVPLSLQEAEKLANHAPTDQYRLAILILFDSGFRRGEYASVRKRHLTRRTLSDGREVPWIECTLSKTKPRCVPIPLFSDELEYLFQKDWFRSLSPDDFLLPKHKQDAFRVWLKRNGKKRLGKEVFPHLLRHSSATFYRRHIEASDAEMYERYGWQVGSKHARVYLHNESVNLVSAGERACKWKRKAEAKVQDLEAVKAELLAKLQEVESRLEETPKTIKITNK